MPRPDHRGNLFFTARSIRKPIAKGAKSPFLRQSKGGMAGRTCVGCHRSAEIIINAVSAQGLFDPPAAISAAQQTIRLGSGIRLIIDITQFNHAFDDRSHIKLRPTTFHLVVILGLNLAPLADLAVQIRFKLARTGGKAGDVGQGQIIELALVQWFRTPLGFAAASMAPVIAIVRPA